MSDQIINIQKNLTRTANFCYLLKTNTHNNNQYFVFFLREKQHVQKLSRLKKLSYQIGEHDRKTINIILKCNIQKTTNKQKADISNTLNSAIF